MRPSTANVLKLDNNENAISRTDRSISERYNKK